MTRPVSPKFHVHKRVGRTQPPMKREERELHEIEAARAEAERKRAENRKNVEKVLAPKGSMLPRRSTKELTTPVEFSFATSSRNSRRPSMTPQNNRRRSATVGASGSKRPQSARRSRSLSRTVPTPFKLSTSNRPSRRPSAPSTPREPAAPKLEEILRTPSTRSGRSTPRTTKAQSPKFHKLSKKKPTVLPSEERELLEMQSRQPFKARPYDSSLMYGSGARGVPRVPKAQPTTFKEFNLATTDRARPAVAVEETYEPFKAQPIRMNSRGGSSRRVAKRPITQPVSPNLTKPKPKQVEEPEEFVFKAQPIKHGKPVFVRKTHTPTVPIGFNLRTDQRGETYQEQLRQAEEERRLREEMDRIVVATPLFDGPPEVAQPAQKKLTVPKSPPLRSLKLAEQARAERERRLQKEEEEAKKLREFKAREVPRGRTFVPRKSIMPPTDAEGFQLMSHIRSSEREEFNEKVRRNREEQLAAEQAQKEAKEKEEEDKYRAQMENHRFRANPWNGPAPVEPVKKSVKPLTEARSPNFATNARHRRECSM